MLYIKPTPNTSGAYSAPQSNPAKGLLAFPEKLLDDFLTNNGFVVLTVKNNTVTAIAANTEARNAWLASLPEPELEETTEEGETE